MGATTMDNFEDERSQNEFEIEFTDLPRDENESRTSSLLVHGAHILTMLRSWYMSIMPRNDIVDQQDDDSFAIEISDLPPDDDQHIFSKLSLFSAHVSLRAHLWRTFIIICTLLMTLMLIFGTFPSLHDNASGLFVRPTPTPTNPVTLYQWSAVRVVTEQTPGVLIIGQKVINTSTKSNVPSGITIWSADLLPGPPPESKDCPARPTIGHSHQVGRPPILATGFSGPLATLHLYPTPVSVPAFPNTFGWTASILFEAPQDYAYPITLNGADIHTGSSLLFQLDSTQDPLAFVTLDPSQPPLNQGNASAVQKVSWSVTIYFPAAGCYFLTAWWPGGHWNINFAAGQ
jgi:hypothetical protein